MEIIGNSTAIKEINDLIKQVANTQANVLIFGESGTGKELVARAIHSTSARKNGNFVPVNCAAIPSELLESELFGHEKGAFTGAIAYRQGRFELANGGSILLDEIGDMPLAMQAKLLRVLQDRTFERIGSNRTITTDVRVIAATNRKLEQAIVDGGFREDLYYRLNVFPIFIPPLRERGDDVVLLVDFFLKNFNKTMNTNCSLQAKAYDSFLKYNWPGNVRELANAVERLCILYPNKAVAAHELPEKLYFPVGSKIENMTETILIKQTRMAAGFDLKEHLFQIEISLINQALLDARWVVSRAAKILGLQRTTLIEKMRKYKLSKSNVG